MTLSVTDRLARVPFFTLGFVLLALLQCGVDEVDPTSGSSERLLGLFLLAFAVSGLVVALLRGPEPVAPGTARSALLLRGGLLATSAGLLLLLLGGGRLNPVVDLLFVVDLLLLAALTLPWQTGPGAADRFLARWAVPAGLAVTALAVPLAAVRVVQL